MLLDETATVADDEDSARIAELEKAVMLDELLTSLRMLDELFTSLREFEELEAIHEELDPSTGLLRPDSALAGTLELLDRSPPLRSEDDEIVEGVEEEDVGAFTDDDTGTVAELDELLLDPVDELVELSLELRMTVCDELFTSLRMLDELFTSLREFEELEAIHEELIKFSDSALNIPSEFSSEQAIKSNKQIGKILYKFISTPLKEYTGELV